MKSITNRRIVSKNGADYYPTPDWATIALLDYETFSSNIQEPACGDGAISKILEGKGYKVLSTDLFDQGYGQSGFDFLKQTKKWDNIVTNPPFNIAGDFVQQCLKLVNKKFALLLRLAFLESVTRYNEIYVDNPPSIVYVFTQRLSMYPKGATVKSGGTTSYAWFVWDKADKSKQTVIKWIKPGYKSSTKIKRAKHEFHIPLQGRTKFTFYYATKKAGAY